MNGQDIVRPAGASDGLNLQRCHDLPFFKIFTGVVWYTPILFGRMHISLLEVIDIIKLHISRLRSSVLCLSWVMKISIHLNSKLQANMKWLKKSVHSIKYSDLLEVNVLKYCRFDKLTDFGFDKFYFSQCIVIRVKTCIPSDLNT